jgi:hypothetical protein
MKRASIAASLVLLISGILASPALAQSGKKGSQVDRATRRAIANAVCQGSSNVTSAGSGCGPCPTYTGQTDSTPTIGAIHLGAFVNPGSSEAYVALNGCEARVYSGGGGVLLRKTRSTWKVVRYDPGMAPNSCERFRYKTGTVLLVCSGGGGGQGVFVDFLSAQYVGPTKSSSDTLIGAPANEGSCDEDVYLFTIERWSQEDVDNDGRKDLRLTVTEAHGTREPDCGELDLDRTARYSLAFRFDGTRFTAVRGSRETVACINGFTYATNTSNGYCPLPS